jgi:hypothetical protein
MLEEISFLKNWMLIFIILLKAEMGRAALFDNVLNVLAIFIIDVRGNFCKDCIGISTLSKIFSLCCAHGNDLFGYGDMEDKH